MQDFLQPLLLKDHHCFSPESTNIKIIYLQQQKKYSNFAAIQNKRLISVAHHMMSLTLDRGAVLLVLAAGFPVPALAVASAFPRSPLTLLTAGRTDFFILSSLMPIHLQLNLCKNRRGGER